MVETIFIAMVYETIVVIFVSILLALILLKYLEKKHKLTLYLFFIFVNFTLAILFSWISKVLVIFSDIEYIKDINITMDPGTLESWFVLRIVDFRFSFLFTTIAIYLSYILKVKAFEKEYNPIYRVIVIIFGIYTGFHSIFIYQAGSVLSMLLAFLFPFIYMSMIYFPFMFRSIQSYKAIKDPIFKRGFLSLAIMSLSFTLVFFFFVIDRLLILLGNPRFTIFYFLAWASVVVGILGAYLGYIRPRSKD